MKAIASKTRWWGRRRRKISPNRTGGGSLKIVVPWPSSRYGITLFIFKPQPMRFQPVDFTILKTQTQKFLKELLLQVFISSQLSTPAIAENSQTLLEAATRNRAALEEIFTKVTRIESLAAGLLYFVSEAFRKEAKTDEFVAWAVDVVKATLRTGVNIDL